MLKQIYIGAGSVPPINKDHHGCLSKEAEDGKNCTRRIER
jgi:hypothetical protein